LLILTRKLGESITIGDNIKVSVLGIQGRQVRLGIDAPQDIVVHREEVYVRIQAENRKAAKSIKHDLFGVVKLIKGKIKGDSKSGTEPPNIDFKGDEPGNRRKDGPNRPGNARR